MLQSEFATTLQSIKDPPLLTARAKFTIPRAKFTLIYNTIIHKPRLFTVVLLRCTRTITAQMRRMIPGRGVL